MRWMEIKRLIIRKNVHNIRGTLQKYEICAQICCREMLQKFAYFCSKKSPASVSSL